MRRRTPLVPVPAVFRAALITPCGQDSRKGRREARARVDSWLPKSSTSWAAVVKRTWVPASTAAWEALNKEKR